MKRNQENAGPAEEFPETNTGFLRSATEGDWEAFIDQYLAPCWREVRIRASQVGLGNEVAEEVLQDTLLRLMSGQSESLPDGRSANPIQRYVDQLTESRQSPARFRTFLRGLIRNLVRESLRRSRRQERTEIELSQLEPVIDASIHATIEKEWLIQKISYAAGSLRRQCQAAKTKGERRLYDVLIRTVVESQKPEEIAEALAIHRSNVAVLQKRANSRLAKALAEVTGISDPRELKATVAKYPDALQRGLSVTKPAST